MARKGIPGTLNHLIQIFRAPSALLAALITKERIIRALRILATVGAPLSIVSLALRLAVSDALPGFRWNLYMPIFMVGPFMLAAPIIGNGPVLLRALLFAAVATLGGYVLRTEQPALFRPAPSIPAGPKAFTVMAYNVQAYKWGERRILRTIKDANPDIVCVVEGTFRNRYPEVLRKGLGPEYHWTLGERLSIASKFPIRESRVLRSVLSFIALDAIVDGPAGPMHVRVVDAYAPRTRNDIDFVAKMFPFREPTPEPVIMCGDFNSPRGSRSLASAVKGYEDSVALGAPRGLLMSWPTIPFPVWQIDHCFHRGALRVVEAHIPLEYASDHAPILVTYQPEEPRP